MARVETPILLRSLQNANVDNDAVVAIRGEIEEVVREGREPDFDADAYEGIYDDCNLDNEEAQFGLTNEMDRISSQDTQSIQEDHEPEPAIKKTKSEPTAARRPSTQLKSPLPALATLNTMPPPPSIPKDTTMKPAPLPNRPPGETLKYASAAAAAAASDKAGYRHQPAPCAVSLESSSFYASSSSSDQNLAHDITFFGSCTTCRKAIVTSTCKCGRSVNTGSDQSIRSHRRSVQRAHLEPVCRVAYRLLQRLTKRTRSRSLS